MQPQILTYRHREDASEQMGPGCLKADPLLPPWRMSGERRDQGLGDQPESSGPDNGEKRLEGRVSRCRTNGSCDGGGEGRCPGSGLGHGGKVS